MSKRKPAAPAPKPAAQQASTRKPRTVVGASIQQKYLSRRQVATLLGCSIKFVIQLVKSGQLQERDFSRFVKRYSLEDVERYVESRRVPAKEAA